LTGPREKNYLESGLCYRKQVIDMKAVVLAAGEGRRLRPLTGTVSKGMLPVANRPILSFVIDALVQSSVTDIEMVVGHRKEKVMNHFGDGGDLGVSINYVEQKFQLGTAHALQQAKDRVEGKFLVVPGDSIVRPEGIRSLVEVEGDDWGMLVTSTSTNSKYGLVEVSGDTLINIKEKQKLTEDLISSGAPSVMALALWDYTDPDSSGLINTGTYRMDDSIFDVIEEEGAGEPTNLTRCLVKKADRVKVKYTDRWLDAVYPWDLLPLNEHCLSRIGRTTGGTVEEGVVIRGEVSLGEQVNVRANSVIRGPVTIGDNTEIGPGACIGPNVSIGCNCRIDPYTVISECVIMDDVTLGSHGSVSHSVIAQGSTIGDFFGVGAGEYTVRLERFTAKKTLGAVVGPDCRIGHHVNLDQGVILGEDCQIGPMSKISRNLPDGTNVV